MKARTVRPTEPWQLERLSYAELLLLSEALLRALRELPLGCAASRLIAAQTHAVREEFHRRAVAQPAPTGLRRAA